MVTVTVEIKLTEAEHRLFARYFAGQHAERRTRNAIGAYCAMLEHEVAPQPIDDSAHRSASERIDLG